MFILPHPSRNSFPSSHHTPSVLAQLSLRLSDKPDREELIWLEGKKSIFTGWAEIPIWFTVPPQILLRMELAMARGDGYVSWHHWQRHSSGNRGQSWMSLLSWTRCRWKQSIKQNHCREHKCPPSTSNVQTHEAPTLNHGHSPAL